MQALLDVILPVFFVIGAGYVATWRRYFSDANIDALMLFTQNFAIPCLLFSAVATLDLRANFEPALMFSFYTGASAGFTVGLLGARFLFGRPWEDSVAIGFIALFSNSVLLGLAITERAYGTEALASNFAIVAVHAPFCYLLGMTVMELVRARGAAPLTALARVGQSIFQNALLIAILLGLAVNLSGIPVPTVLMSGIDLTASAALPAALFGMGGVLARYRPEGDLKTVFFVSAVSLILHPAITWTLGKATGLSDEAFRSAVLTAAMAPGVNTYIFANMYGVARRVAASAVLLATALSIGTAWVWLTLLP
ncbi:MAG: AEC family transporter [Pseudomonadota bacterium]